MIELNEVIYHWKKGQNNSQIARSLGISRPTVRLDSIILKTAVETQRH